MKNILLDTNIVIYLLEGDRSTVAYVERFKDHQFCISIITWIELLAGSFHNKKTIKEIRPDVGHFMRLPLTEYVALLSAEILQNEFKKRKRPLFQDSVIAATAIHHRMPLMTNNPRDFRGIKNLKLITPR